MKKKEQSNLVSLPLYEYIEDKIKKKAIAVECKKEETKTSRSESTLKNKSCGCC